MPILLTVAEVAERWKQSEDTVRRKIARGEIQAVRLGEYGPLRVPADELGKHLRPALESRRENVGAFAVDAAATRRYSRGSSPAPGDLRSAPGGQPIEGMR
jgi:excisionase family DNA binding protein